MKVFFEVTTRNISGLGLDDDSQQCHEYILDEGASAALLAFLDHIGEPWPWPDGPET